MTQSSKKIINAWCLYDWANSVYLLVITSTIFPVYYNGVTRVAFDSEVVEFFGFEIVNTVLYSYSISCSFLVVAVLSPLLSGIADYSGKKKMFLKMFTTLGALSSAMLYLFNGHNVEFGIIFSILASIGYTGSLVFYNAYLPEIANEENYDSISARGYSFGYIGSVLMLVGSLVLIEKFEFFGFESELQAVRLSFLLVGVWWFLFAQLSFVYLPKGSNKSFNVFRLIFKGYQEINKVLGELRHLSMMRIYLISFFFYSAGVQTIMLLAATFGDKELGLESSKLILTVLIIQFVGIIGAHSFARISKKYGNKTSIMTMLIIWIGVCLYAYIVRTEYQFYFLAFVVGMIMGGIQSMSRSTFSKLIPQSTVDNTSFFSFYDVTEKVSVVAGTFSYGLIEQLTGSMRNSTLVLASYFVIGIVFLLLSGLNVGKPSVKPHVLD